MHTDQERLRIIIVRSIKKVKVTRLLEQLLLSVSVVKKSETSSPEGCEGPEKFSGI